jgi:hypothetical protein
MPLLGALCFGGVAIEFSALTTIYDADDSAFVKAADRVDDRNRKSADVAERSTAEIVRAYRESGREAARAAEEAARAQERALTSALRGRQSAIQSLAADLPGGRFLNQFGQLKKDLDDIRKAEMLTGQSTSALSTVVDGLGGAWVVAGAAAAAATVGALAGGAALFSLAKTTADAGSRFHDMSAATGLSVETLSGLELQLTQSNASLETFTRSTFELQKRQAEAQSGNKQLISTFEQLGVSLTADADTAMRQALKSLGQMEDASQRNAVGARLFGRSYKELATFVKDTNGDIDAAIEKARRLGLVWSEDAADAADQLGDDIDELKGSLAGLGRELGVKLFPLATEGVENLTHLLQENRPAISDFFDTFVKKLRDVAEESKRTYDDLKPLIDRLTEANNKANQIIEAGAGKQGPVSFGANLSDATFGRHVVGPDFIPSPNKEPLSSLAVPLKEPKAEGLDFDFAAGRNRGESAARKAAQQALQFAQIELREAQDVYALGNQIARRAYDQNLTDLESYINNRLKLEEERHKAVQAGFEAERAAARSLPTEAEQNLKLKDINQRAKQETREFEDAQTATKLEGQQKRLEIATRYAEAEIGLTEETHRTIEAAIALGVKRGIHTREELEEQSFADLSAVLQAQGELLHAKMTRAALNPDAAAAVEQEMRALNQRIEQANIEHNSRISDARDEDIQDAQRHAQALRSIYAQVSDINAEIRQFEIDALRENRFNPRAAIEAQRVLNGALETARSGRALAELHERRRQQEANPDRKDAAAITRALNAEIEAEERLHQARIVEIDRRANEERRQQLVDLGNDIAGILTSGLEQFDGTWGSIWRGMLDEALSTLRQIGAELLKLSFEGLLTGKTQGSGAGGIVGFLVNAVGGALLGGLGGGGNLPAANAGGGVWAGLPVGGHAEGTQSSPPGLFWVGEEGPELMAFKGGERVYNNAESRSMTSQTVINKVTNIYYQPRVTTNSVTSRRSSRESFEALLSFAR